VVAIKAQVGNERLGAEIASASLGPANPGGDRQLIYMGDLAASAYTVGSGSITVDGARIDRNGVMVYAVMPQGTLVRVTANGAVLSNTAVVTSLLIRSGVVIPEPVRGPGSAMLRLHVPPVPPLPAISTLSNGVTVVNNDEARRHGLSLTRPARISVQTASSPGSQTSRPARRAALGLWISPAGVVTQVQIVSGDPELAVQAKAAVSTWRFMPFMLNGSAAEVRTLVMFTAGSDGNVSSSID